MSDKPENQSSENSSKKFGRRRGGRRMDSKKMEELEAKKSEQKAREDADKALEEREQQSQDKAPKLDKEQLCQEYTQALQSLTELRTEKAALQTELSRISASHAVIINSVEQARLKNTAKLAAEKTEKTQAFLSSLEAVQKDIEDTAQAVYGMAQGAPDAAGIAKGLEMVGQGLVKIFNTHAAPAAASPDSTAPAPAPAPQAETFEPELPTARNLDDLDAVAVNLELTHLKRQIEKAVESRKNLQDNIETAKEDLAHAGANRENDIARSQRDYEEKSPFVLKKIAVDAVGAADNLTMAVHALNAQREQLGKSFNDIAGLIGKTAEKMQNTLKQFGIEKIDVKPGDKFDYNLHNAVNTGPSTPEIPADHILDVMGEGYRLNGQSLRDPMVRVAN